MKYKIRLAAAVAAALVAGCATSAKTYGPDGREAFVIKCMLDDCQKKAGDICGQRGYDIVSSQGFDKPAPSVNINVLSNQQTNNALNTKSMLVSCKG
jgi:hypothetical protein